MRESAARAVLGSGVHASRQREQCWGRGLANPFFGFLMPGRAVVGTLARVVEQWSASGSAENSVLKAVGLVDFVCGY